MFSSTKLGVFLACIFLIFLKGLVNGKRSDDLLLVESEPSEKLFLTKYLNDGKLEEARKASFVNWSFRDTYDSIPSYTGFLTVNETTNSNLFFWFIPAVMQDPAEAPLIIWLNGGPGISSMYGLFVENGPFKIKKRGRIPRLVLRLRKDTWARKHSMLYIDSPVGTGFSFTDDEAGYAKTQEDITRDLYEGIQQFLKIFPNYSKLPVFLAGESYAGKHVPHLGVKIHDENEKENSTRINLQGAITGGPFTDPLIMTSHYSDYLYYLGLLDDSGRAHFKKQEAVTAQLVQDGKLEEALKLNDDLIFGKFSDSPTYFNNVSGFGYISNLLETKRNKKRAYYSQFLNMTSVRKVIHVGDQQFVNISKKVLGTLRGDIYRSCKPEMEKLINLKYKVLIYVGQLDLLTPHVAVTKFVQSMDFDGKDEFQKAQRQIIRDSKKGHVAGYMKSEGNFHYVILRNAGHSAARDQPRWTRSIVERFITGDQSLTL